MRKLPKLLVCSILAVCFIIPLNAYAVRIDDNYYGADDHTWGDLIGPPDFEIDYMDVSIVDHTMYVDIYTNFDQPGPFSSLPVQYGDLFISTNGWHPSGDQPYLSDNASNGETWEYAFDVSTGGLYDITYHQGAIVLAEAEMPGSGWTFRDGQEVLINPPNGLTPVTTGEIGAYNSVDHIYSLEIALGSLDWDLNDLGFHWTMTCGNDVIEGAASVPEPATMLSFSWGLIGLAVVGRKKFFKQV